jgi:hypothetical protein
MRFDWNEKCNLQAVAPTMPLQLILSSGVTTSMGETPMPR